MRRIDSRGFVVLASVAFGILSPILQHAADIGLSASEFAADGNETLRAASYAFSLWTLIHAWLVAYAILQFTATAAESAVARMTAPAATVAILGTVALLRHRAA